MKKEFKYKEFNPYKNLLLIKLLLNKLKLHPIIIGLIVYAGYYFGTMFLSGFGKVLFTPEHFDNYFVPAVFKDFLATNTTPDCTLAFLKDKSHFAFSTFVVLPGSIISIYFLNKLAFFLRIFVENEIITSHINRVNGIFEKFQKRIGNIFIHIIIIIASILGFLTFFGFTRSADFIYWWGNINYGWAGIFLAFLIGFMIYHALYILYISYLFVRFIKEMMSINIKLRPFHPDACNGYLPLGNIIFILFGLSIVVAIAVFIVIYLGFLDLQKTVFIWVLILGCLTLTPILLLLPSYYVVSKLKSEKKKLLLIIERRMNQITEELEKQLIDEKNIANIMDELLKIKESFSIYNEISIWPFNIRLVQTIVLSYILQIALLLIELLG